MKNPDNDELIDKAMANRLTPEEELRWAALIAKHPELEHELALGRALRSLPEPPPVSSNFTARVLQEITRESHSTRGVSWPSWFRWPRFAMAAALLALGLFMVNQQKQQNQMARTVETFAGVVSAVTPAQTEVQPEAVMAVLKDFEAIRRLPDSAPVDYGLMAALGSN